jgi:hypothetical protein
MKYPPPPHNSPFRAFYSATQAFNSGSEGNNSGSGAFCSDFEAKDLREDAFYSVATPICWEGGVKNSEGGSVRWVMDLKRCYQRQKCTLLIGNDKTTTY